MPRILCGLRKHPGGKNHYAADREVADKVLAGAPSARTGPRENRAFLGRAVRFLTAEVGIRQFLDIGTGLPTTDNVHEVAQRIAPSSRVVYVDNDPLVLAHARALLTSSPEGRTAYIQADLRDPAAILSDPTARAILDFNQPIALMLVAILHFIPDEFRPAEILATLLDALPSGSYLVASQVSMEDNPVLIGNAMSAYQAAGLPAQARDSDDFARLAFAGLELVPPGVVLVSEWRPGTDAPRPTPAELSLYGGVGRKPLCPLDGCGPAARCSARPGRRDRGITSTARDACGVLGDLVGGRGGRGERDLERLRVDHAQERQRRLHVLGGGPRQAVPAPPRGRVGVQVRVRVRRPGGLGDDGWHAAPPVVLVVWLGPSAVVRHPGGPPGFPGCIFNTRGTPV